MNPFADVVGQPAAAAALRAHLERTGGAGSTLLVGPEGVGRFLLAHRAARFVLGADDAQKRQVDAFTHPDLQVLTPDAGIKGIRDVIRTLQRRPALGPRQVLILRDIDRFSHDAHNALLKTLEEPPAAAAVLLVAEDVTLLPETVVSRCRVFRARRLSETETVEVLGRHDAPAEAARDAEGSPGRALYHIAAGVAEPAGRLVDLLTRSSVDPLGEADSLARRRRDEDLKDYRHRLIEICRVAATRLRLALPDTAPLIEAILEASAALTAHANPGIVMAELALREWKNRSRS